MLKIKKYIYLKHAFAPSTYIHIFDSDDKLNNAAPSPLDYRHRQKKKHTKNIFCYIVYFCNFNASAIRQTSTVLKKGKIPRYVYSIAQCTKRRVLFLVSQSMFSVFYFTRPGMLSSTFVFCVQDKASFRQKVNS